mgnify:FL=1
MNKSFIIAVVMTACSLTACGPSQKEKERQAAIEAEEEEDFKDSVEQAAKEAARKAYVQDSIAKAKAAKLKAQAEQDAQAKAIIRKLFGMAVGSIEYDENYLRNHCTDKMLSNLVDEYDDSGYSAWSFRTGVQDGDGPSKMVSIKSLGDNWYRYDFLDMGFKGAKKVHFVYENGDLMLDKLVTLIEPE